MKNYSLHTIRGSHGFHPFFLFHHCSRIVCSGLYKKPVTRYSSLFANDNKNDVSQKKKKPSFAKVMKTQLRLLIIRRRQFFIEKINFIRLSFATAKNPFCAHPKTAQLGKMLRGMRDEKSFRKRVRICSTHYSCFGPLSSLFANSTYVIGSGLCDVSVVLWSLLALLRIFYQLLLNVCYVACSRLSL